jgi:hypothetical protein
MLHEANIVITPGSGFGRAGEGYFRISAFPAYVVHWSDYSAGRATPLDKEVRLAPTEEEAMKIADGMIADNIKKGWEKVG